MLSAQGMERVRFFIAYLNKWPHFELVDFAAPQGQHWSMVKQACGTFANVDPKTVDRDFVVRHADVLLAMFVIARSALEALTTERQDVAVLTLSDLPAPEDLRALRDVARDAIVTAAGL